MALNTFLLTGATAVMVLAVAGCATSQGRLEVMGVEDMPPTPLTTPPRHAPPGSTIELPSDEDVVEPNRPALETAQARVLVHVHLGGAPCSGILIAPRIVMTARHCADLGADPKALHPKDHYVEVGSSTLTWARRTIAQVLVPNCEWQKLDLAAIVLEAPVEHADAVRIVTTPDPGVVVHAFGFGRCAGEARGIGDRAGPILHHDTSSFVIDVPMCQGDVGGGVLVRQTTDLLGIISRRAPQPHGQTTPTTLIVRMDTGPARALVAQAKASIDGKPSAIPVECE